MTAPSATVFLDYAGKTPHAFIKLDDGNGGIKYYGFGPATSNSLFARGVVGVGLTTKALGDPNNSKAGYIDEASWSKTIPLSGSQHADMQARVEKWIADRPGYNVFGTNCTAFVKDILAAGKATYPGITWGPGPFNLVPVAEQGPLFITDPDGRRVFTDAVRKPLETPGTPAYDAKMNPGKYGLPVHPPASPGRPAKMQSKTSQAKTRMELTTKRLSLLMAARGQYWAKTSTAMAT